MISRPFAVILDRKRSLNPFILSHDKTVKKTFRFPYRHISPYYVSKPGQTDLKRGAKKLSTGFCPIKIGRLSLN